MVVRAEQFLGHKFRLYQGFRSEAVNWRVGGKPNSYHLRALAVDGSFDGLPMLEACRLLAASDLDIVEIEAKQTMLHLAAGPRSARKLFMQYVTRGAVVQVEAFPDDVVRG